MRTKKLTSDGTVIKRKKPTEAESKEQEKINLVRLLFKQAAGQPMTATDISARLDAIRTTYVLWWEHSLERGGDDYGVKSFRMISNITELKASLKIEGTITDSVEASAQYALMMAKESDLDLSHMLDTPEQPVC